MINVQVRASRELAFVAARLKAAGDGGVHREVRRGLRNGARPVADAAHAAALERLPHAGGLNEWVADGLYGVRTNLGGAHPSVRVVVSKKGHDLKAIDAGKLRHPVFGHRDRWMTQQIPPHILTDAMRDAAPEARAELARTLDEYVRRLA